MRIEKRYLGVLVLTSAMLLGMDARAAETARPMSLSDSIELALRQSVLIHSAREGVRGAEAHRKEALTGFLPRFSTSYSYTRLNEDPTFPSSDIKVTTGLGTVKIPANAYQSGSRDNYHWTVEARQPLFAGGGIRANYEASRLGVEIAKFEESLAILDLIQEVKIAYFNILKADRILAVARKSLERSRAHRDVAEAFFNVGAIPKNDLLYAEVEAANSRQALVRAENGVEMARSKFNTVLRREIGAPVGIEDILNDLPFEKSLEECISEAIENRPEVRLHALRVEQAKTAVAATRSEYLPTLNLVGNYAKYGDTPGVSGSPYQEQESWNVMAVANWNFWEWGKTRNRVHAGLSRENQAADLLTHVRDQIALEVKNAFLLLHEAEQQIRVMKKAIDQAEENFRINTERYREQVGTSTDVIDAQTLLTKVRSDHDNALGDYCISRARLERAMGIAVPGT